MASRASSLLDFSHANSAPGETSHASARPLLPYDLDLVSSFQTFLHTQTEYQYCLWIYIHQCFTLSDTDNFLRNELRRGKY